MASDLFTTNSSPANSGAPSSPNSSLPNKETTKSWQPLAARMRPQNLSAYLGQEHLLGADKPLRQALDAGQLHSMLLWGPPGVGKTTLARLIAEQSQANFISLSAVMAGVKEIRAAVQEAQTVRQQHNLPSLVFVDEVHRFNKSQQDAFLPYVEDGTFIFIGATTENPSFELNAALLSRARVYVLQPLETQQLIHLLQTALTSEQGLAQLNLQAEPASLELIAKAADGDARRALNFLELAADLATENLLTPELVRQVLQSSWRQFDKQGDIFYDQISALHKSVRGSNADASLYWLARMLDGGCDPVYLARRLVRIASEDIGNADPRALQIAMNAWDVQTRLGSPEGELALAQAVVYLAVAPKSNAVYTAFKAVQKHIQTSPSYAVPEHLRNAPTELLAELGHGASYRYAHDEPEAYAAGENYLPPEMQGLEFYQPVPRGLEAKIATKMQHLRQLDAEFLAHKTDTDF